MPPQNPLQPDLFNVPDQGGAGLLALIEMIRGQTIAMEKTGEKVDSLSSSVAKVREDIAVLKAEGQRDAQLSQEVAALKTKIAALELRNAQQDGGMKFVTFLKDFAPWLATLAMGFVAFFNR